MKFTSLFAIFFAASTSAVFGAPLPEQPEAAVQASPNTNAPANTKEWVDYNKNAFKNTAGGVKEGVESSFSAAGAAFHESAHQAKEGVKAAAGAVGDAAITAGGAVVGAGAAAVEGVADAGKWVGHKCETINQMP